MSLHTQNYLATKLFPDFSPIKVEVIQNHPNMFVVIVFALVFALLFFVAFKKARKNRVAKKKYQPGEILEISKNKSGQYVVHPLSSDCDKVITKLRDGQVVNLLVSHSFQLLYETSDVIRARFIDPRFAKTPDGMRILPSRGFNFPDYYKIGCLTFGDIENESEFCLVDFIQKQAEIIGDSVYRPEPERKFLTNT